MNFFIFCYYISFDESVCTDSDFINMWIPVEIHADIYLGSSSYPYM